jgi:hypothetical protein
MEKLSEKMHKNENCASACIRFYSFFWGAGGLRVNSFRAGVLRVGLQQRALTVNAAVVGAAHRSDRKIKVAFC